MNSPLDSVDPGIDGVGVENVTAQTAHCSDLQHSLGLDKDLMRVSEGQHSRKGWTGGNHLLNIDPALGCRRRGHSDNLQALPTSKAQKRELNIRNSVECVLGLQDF